MLNNLFPSFELVNVFGIKRLNESALQQAQSSAINLITFDYFFSFVANADHGEAGLTIPFIIRILSGSQRTRSSDWS